MGIQTQIEERELEDNVYEAPRVEFVLTGDELERELHYAGGHGTFIPDL